MPLLWCSFGASAGPTFLLRHCACRGGREACGSDDVSDPVLLAVDWDFNAWGGNCYDNWEADAAVARKVVGVVNSGVRGRGTAGAPFCDLFAPGLVMEGALGWG